MVRNNYNAWDINLNNFPKEKLNKERLKFLIKFAILAPSSHNSQPWIINITNEETIEIRPEKSRTLPASDANHRQLFISLGCIVENLIIVADYYGYNSTVKININPDPLDTYITVNTVDGGMTKQDMSHLANFITTRATNRSKYKMQLPPYNILDEMVKLKSPDVELFLVSDKEQKDKLAENHGEAMLAAMTPDFREELSHFVLPNNSKAFYGMPGNGYGMPLPISLLFPFVVRHFNVGVLNKKQDETIIKKHTPMIALICTPNDEIVDWISAGRSYMTIALTAEKYKLGTAPLAATIQIQDYYKKAQQIIKTTMRPQMFIRLGCPVITNPPHSPRLNIIQ